MAELTSPPASECCSTERQAGCCEPSDKADCCTPESSSCGCPAGQDDVREQVRERYAAAARATDGATVALVHRLHRRCPDAARDTLIAAGLGEVEIRETHRVHEQATAAIIRARKPTAT